MHLDRRIRIQLVVYVVITLVAAFFTKETFHKDLNYIESDEVVPSS